MSAAELEPDLDSQGRDGIGQQAPQPLRACLPPSPWPAPARWFFRMLRAVYTTRFAPGTLPFPGTSPALAMVIAARGIAVREPSAVWVCLQSGSAARYLRTSP